MGLAKAKLWNVSVNPPVATEVMFNPTDYGIDRGANYAELDVPGLKTPILQFVRGEAQTLSLSLFLDGSDARRPVKEALTALRKFISIDGELHTPPVCLFEWGDVRFQGVATSLKEKFSLFDSDGNVVRATVTLTLKSYEAVEVQIRDMKRSSPDRTRVRTPCATARRWRNSPMKPTAIPGCGARLRHRTASTARAFSPPGKRCGFLQCKQPKDRR